MRVLKNTIFGLVLFLVNITVYAQQTPIFTHYMNNTLMVNPAYAGSRDALTVTALHRSQWVGYKGAPQTQTLTIHSPLINKHIGLGLSVYHDKIGPINNTSVVSSYAFIMKLNEKSKLALGLSAGINIYQADLSSILLDQQSDPVFENSIDNHVTPNFGVGVYYTRKYFYAGVSAPNLMQNSYSEIKQSDGTFLISREKRNAYIILGSILSITSNLSFKPSTLIKWTLSAPIQADFTASFIIKNRILVGVMFRTGDSFGGLVGLDITKQLHLGYSFDWSYGLSTFKYNQGSHELMLRYDFIFFNKDQVHSPGNF